MKKFLSYFMAILMVTAVLLVDAVVVFLVITSPHSSENSLAPSVSTRYAGWQKELDADALITEVVMPGAHDAGTVGIANIMETQGHRVSVQLNYGCRYFDLRPMLYQNTVYPFHGLPNVFYPFAELLQEIFDFVEASPDEFVILDFQHFSKAEEATKEMLKASETVGKYAVPSSVDLSTLTVGEMRDNNYRIIIVWNESYSVADLDMLHGRKENLYSPYNETAHKGENQDLIAKFKDYYKNKPQDVFFVLQAQRTGTFGKEMNIFALEKLFRPDVNLYLQALEGENLKNTNIVMRDFITLDEETVKTILNLNYKKGFIDKPFN